ncbi:type II toxin-antitoxin system RelE/ParE family toxin [Flavobacterium cheongpyeongense]|uniref:Type II toxin-antitoxin system RelE/ParE family toxin n=1 Tax=Flavobacterium cheongpyeongense TaxID=2212651 RepID=A0A2V4C2L1_9FLAO|nr:type II toxin-antitoxin system RelE/ParE family toxin [Flavobacterium cheongpyeongense]PXY40454.1 type II toxin-antitoxin system RelE/ParE family toxin [Flavobacterium cheongpyeongense]
MAKRVIWTAKAKASRKSIITSLISKKYAKKLSAEINSIIDNFSKFELIGKESDYKTIRVFVFKNYSIYYKLELRQIVIIGILDNRRNPNETNKNIDL